jgi:hypothetical protein
MKKIIALSIAFLVASTTLGQKISETALPEAVSNAFKIRFPGAKNVKWEKEDSVYSAKFLMNEAPTESEFDTSGLWKNTEWNVPVEYTPQTIKTYLDSAYAGYKIKELTILESATDMKMYVAEVNNKKEKTEVYFTLTGVFRKALKQSCCDEKKMDKKKNKCEKKCDESKK